jgi:hypothetical protein
MREEVETIVNSFGLGTWVALRLQGKIHDRTKAKKKETFDASPNFVEVRSASSPFGNSALNAGPLVRLVGGSRLTDDGLPRPGQALRRQMA